MLKTKSRAIFCMVLTTFLNSLGGGGGLPRSLLIGIQCL